MASPDSYGAALPESSKRPQGLAPAALGFDAGGAVAFGGDLVGK
jgi:hypothetical protein